MALLDAFADEAKRLLTIELTAVFPEVQTAWATAWTATHKLPKWYANTYSIRDFALYDMLAAFIKSTRVIAIPEQRLIFMGTIDFNVLKVNAASNEKQTGMSDAAITAIRGHGANPITEGVIGSFWKKADTAVPYLTAFLEGGPNINNGSTGPKTPTIFTALGQKRHEVIIATTRDKERGEALMEHFAKLLGVSKPLGHEGTEWVFGGDQKDPGILTACVNRVVLALKADPVYGMYF